MSSTLEKLGMIIIMTITTAIIFVCLSSIFVFADSYNEPRVYEELVTADDESREDDGNYNPKIFYHSDPFIESDVRHTWGGHR